MAKSDFKCEYCGVKSIGFLRISSFRKHTCPKCNTQIPENKKFCPECGEKLGNTCSKCGASVKKNNKFF